MLTASINTSARSVEKLDMPKKKSLTLSPTTAEWSQYAEPLPRPPLSETSNSTINKTIADHPDLFQVVTPINIDRFEKILDQHPNQPFVHLVYEGLCEGFWLWPDTLHENFSLTHDDSCSLPSDPVRAMFIQDQCVAEQERSGFQDIFSCILLPGMYSMPVHAIDKPNSTNLHLITDHSAGSFLLNSMIDHSKVTGYPLDNLCNLGEILLDVRHSIGNAYHLLPVSPYWQLKQINANLAFGSSVFPAIFISFNSLIAWIAKYVLGFNYLANYVDDSFGCGRLSLRLVTHRGRGKE
ncbi:hypothetical protein BYT27DRAFT_7310174 [Phlegmacium glaucopus]|nr:hypothetical protein BYT27DRAFT_7310174 [Phlegmacium glaucopus]